MKMPEEEPIFEKEEAALQGPESQLKNEETFSTPSFEESFNLPDEGVKASDENIFRTDEKPTESFAEKEEEIGQVTDKPASEEFVFVPPVMEEEKTFKFEEEFVEQKEEKTGEAVQPPLEFEALKPQRNWLSYIIAILIIILFSGTGVGLIWWQKTKLLEQEGNFGINGAKIEFYDSKTLEKVLVVKGNVVNGYMVPKSFIKIKATIKSKDNKVIATKMVFAGNTFSESEIKELTFAEIEKGLNNKMGKSMINVDIPAGKSLPFMVVFDKIPPEAAFIEVESL